MITIYLHGALKKLGHDSLKLAVSSPAEAIRALCSQVKGFEQALRDGSFVLLRGDKNNGLPITGSSLDISFGQQKEFHIVPEVQGAAEWVVYGVILLVAVYAATNIPKVANYEERNEEGRQSHIFNGALNSTEQGQAIPIIYGRIRVGSIPISAGLTS
ncbi:hypothetical protein NO559_07805 [Dasania sp. GY-MA-18]|uniref:Tail assembly protein n=1 Tax=Dasania phycosphaerae TaxID=2950436 RepID=A0A9J6RKZ8_9GAMM|nr:MULTISPECIES: hypothetical protein [Dasania]MCR8922670.1 hypothetical protein [Dasania sp. GY-MA-18]MCZ0865100.1 hypothetical protein [Dasania phycosphaerae]MCZ0868826.1 hypothetical protein [Dasania phycosphaerae]